MPAQMGQMWDGALNVFDLGRMRAFNTLEVEDWTGSHVNVAFAMGLLKAAARKNKQDLASLIVGHNTKKRIIANLSQKVHILVFYLYGPVHRIGPVWAEHPPSLRQIGEALRMTARCEPDLLASDNRPCDAAILVANTSEMHEAYGSWGFARERLTLFQALLAAHVPVEIVGEEEIIEDNALSRYRVLYVGESHVDSRAQEAIKEWVRGGGTLWASYSALIRKEYDEDSRLFDEVFGLASRGEVAPLAERGEEVPVCKIAAADERLPLVRFESRGQKPQYQLSTGKALASFEDGSAAVVLNAFGEGHAFLCGFRLSGTHASAEKEENSAALLRDARAALVRAAAEAAEVRPHVKVDVPALRTWVHDGPEQTVVFLINDSGGAIEDVPMEVFLPRPATSAYSGRTGELQVEPKEGSAVVKLNIPQDDCDIIVLK
jgi:hypothetical protein